LARSNHGAECYIVIVSNRTLSCGHLVAFNRVKP